MFKKSLSPSVLAITVFLAGAGFAYADCEADLGQLEAAMAGQLTPDQTKALTDAGEKASSALRKDDDEACHQIITEALAKVGVAGNTTAAPAAGASGPLGDLSSFTTIAQDSLSLVQKGDLEGAKARIADLETSWDKAEASLKPVNPTSWGTVDKAIDKALKALRSQPIDKTASADALTQLMDVLKQTK